MTGEYIYETVTMDEMGDVSNAIIDRDKMGWELVSNRHYRQVIKSDIHWMYDIKRDVVELIFKKKKE